MLWTITLALFALWVIGRMTLPALGAWIHLLLVLVVISAVYNLVGRGRGMAASRRPR